MKLHTDLVYAFDLCIGLVCGWDFLEKTGVQWSYHFQREMLGMAASSTDPDVLYVCARKTKLGAKHIDKQVSYKTHRVCQEGVDVFEYEGRWAPLLD